MHRDELKGDDDESEVEDGELYTDANAHGDHNTIRDSDSLEFMAQMTAEEARGAFNLPRVLKPPLLDVTHAQDGAEASAGPTTDSTYSAGATPAQVWQGVCVCLCVRPLSRNTTPHGFTAHTGAEHTTAPHSRQNQQQSQQWRGYELQHQQQGERG